jgi:uncharacterized protein (DUF924 family)
MNRPGPEDVLQFWFGPPEAPPAPREAWFRKDADFDERIRAAFGPLVDDALAGALPAAQGWRGSPRATLAEILVLDQFPRNLFRGSARSFAGDPRALALALGLLTTGGDAMLSALERWFAYLPLEHAEDLALQDRCVALFTRLAAADASRPAALDAPLASALDYAERHRAVIRRFGRFPHRNEWLGRASSAEELDFLSQPGSRF